jgi:hypothetical protein
MHAEWRRGHVYSIFCLDKILNNDILLYVEKYAWLSGKTPPNKSNRISDVIPVASSIWWMWSLCAGALNFLCVLSISALDYT